MEDHRFFWCVKYLLIIYNICVLIAWVALLVHIIQSSKEGKQEIEMFPKVPISRLFAFTLVRVVIVITIAIFGLIALIKENYFLTMGYAICEALVLIALTVIVVFNVYRFPLVIIALGIQAAVTLLAYGFAAALLREQNNYRPKTYR